jgi:hypothetical protein
MVSRNRATKTEESMELNKKNRGQSQVSESNTNGNAKKINNKKTSGEL